MTSETRITLCDTLLPIFRRIAAGEAPPANLADYIDIVPEVLGIGEAARADLQAFLSELPAIIMANRERGDEGSVFERAVARLSTTARLESPIATVKPAHAHEAENLLRAAEVATLGALMLLGGPGFELRSVQSADFRDPKHRQIFATLERGENLDAETAQRLRWTVVNFPLERVRGASLVRIAVKRLKLHQAPPQSGQR